MLKQNSHLARNNPFATRHVERIPFRFQSGTWPEHLERLKSLGFRASIVGPHGSGKTTLLTELLARMSEHSHPIPPAVYGFVSRTGTERALQLDRWISDSQDGKCLLVDGLERFSLLQRMRLYKTTCHSAGLIVTVHKRCRLPVWLDCQTGLSILQHVLNHLPVEADEKLVQTAQSLLRRRKGNIRMVLRDLYDFQFRQTCWIAGEKNA